MADPASSFGPVLRSTPGIKRALSDILGGVSASVLTITFGLSYSLLIFTGPLAPYLGYAVGTTFITSAILAFVIAAGSTLPFAVGAPDSSTAAMTGIVASSLVERIAASDPSLPVLLPVLITFGFTSIATGLMLFGFGVSRMGRAIRYVPYPVVGGFLGATGCLIVLGAIGVITGQRLQFSTLASFAQGVTLYEIGAACAMAFILYATLRRSRTSFALPILLIAGTLTAHAAFWASGMTSQDAQIVGWTFSPPEHVALLWPWHRDAFDHYPWTALLDNAGNLIAVLFVTASSTLFNTTAVEVATHREADLERELNVTGLANILCGVFGGYTGCISVSRSVLSFSAGATGRLSGFTAAAISLAMLEFAPSLLGVMPRFVLGGLLLYLGADTMHKWLVQSRRRLSALEYLSLLAIVIIILQWGFVAGISIGVVIGCATFALSASRIESIKFAFDGSEYRSSLDRSRNEQALLSAHGRKIQVLKLQSYLFFGSANRLYRHVKALLQSCPECDFLIFDFTLVTGIDSSAAYSFDQIKRAANERKTRIVLVHLPAPVAKALRAVDFVSSNVQVMPELDYALEWCENEIIAEHRSEEQEEASLRAWFTQILGDEDDALKLMQRCDRVEVQAGEVIVRSDEPADSMHFILEGRVGIMIPAGDKGLTRVRSLGRYTTIGEMGLVSQVPRSATIQAEIDSVLYVLTRHHFEALKAHSPALGQKLLTYFVTIMAERLKFANQMISVLKR